MGEGRRRWVAAKSARSAKLKAEPAAWRARPRRCSGGSKESSKYGGLETMRSSGAAGTKSRRAQRRASNAYAHGERAKLRPASAADAASMSMPVMETDPPFRSGWQDGRSRQDGCSW